MEITVKSIRTLENGIARYIFRKYINPSQKLPELPETTDEDNIVEVADREGVVDDGDDIEVADDGSGNEGGDAIEENEGEGDCDGDGNGGECDDVIEEGEAKPNKKELDMLFKIFQRKIFILERQIGILDADTELKKEIEELKLASDAYDEDPDNFKPSEYDSLPDVLRCSYIRKHKHRYYRCRNRIMNNDSDICYKHEDSENIYIDIYNDMCERIQST